MGKRILVTGGRKFALPDEVHRILHPLHLKHGIDELGHGEAKGLDTLAKLWALSYGVPVAGYEIDPHQVKLYGGRAGNMRNSRMLRSFQPDLGVSFPGGPGTRDMTKKMLDAELGVLVGRYTDPTQTRLKWRLK